MKGGNHLLHIPRTWSKSQSFEFIKPKSSGAPELLESAKINPRSWLDGIILKGTDGEMWLYVFVYADS